MKKKSIPSTDDLTFDMMEAKIRGEERLEDEEARKEKEERSVKKALQAQEVERRLKELKEAMGNKEGAHRKGKKR